MAGKIKRIEIDLKDSGSVVTCYRKPDDAQKKKDIYCSEYDNREEHAFTTPADAVAKVITLLAEVKE